jgi:hypothetical protein
MLHTTLFPVGTPIVPPTPTPFLPRLYKNNTHRCEGCLPKSNEFLAGGIHTPPLAQTQ